MSKSHRDDFTEPTKRALALRASYLCSLPTCRRSTVGPSEEGPTRSATIGVAAHIKGAAPDSKRYDASITPAERRDISNGIWVCADHGTLIDRDDVTYTVERLHELKREHEEWRARELAAHGATATGQTDLIAIGSDIVGYGQISAVSNSSWTVALSHFLLGDRHALIRFVESFDKRSPEERYVIVNSLGDGRLLAAAPRLEFDDAGCNVICVVEPAFPRIRAQELGADFALKDGDLVFQDGDIATISGVEALEQKIRISLLTQRGDLMMHPDFGARLLEYHHAFKGSPWLERLLKLEVIRLAAIPYFDGVTKQRYTPLQCVDRVKDLAVAESGDERGEIAVSVDLEVRGVGSVNQVVLIRL